MPELDMQQNLGRAKNAIQDYLIRKLLYPKVYLDADWNGTHVDVLAIDRTGVGDVHSVRIIPVHFEDGPANWQEHVVKAAMVVGEHCDELMALPGHFRYVALFNEASGLRRFEPTTALIQKITATDGVGRLGILIVDFADEQPSVRATLNPERFRSSKDIFDIADRYMSEHIANWEMRE
jgi:hypothetical protein